MKYFNIFSKIAYILFFVLTAMMLIFALITLKQKDVIFPGLRYLFLSYLLILLIALITMIINIIIIIKELKKIAKVKSILKRVCIGAVTGAIIVNLLSLIKHHEFFSSEFIYLLFVVPIFSLFLLFLQIEKK